MVYFLGLKRVVVESGRYQSCVGEHGLQEMGLGGIAGGAVAVDVHEGMIHAVVNVTSIKILSSAIKSLIIRYKYKIQLYVSQNSLFDAALFVGRQHADGADPAATS